MQVRCGSEGLVLLQTEVRKRERETEGRKREGRREEWSVGKKKKSFSFYKRKEEISKKKKVQDSTMLPHKHISEQIRDQNVSIIC